MATNTTASPLAALNTAIYIQIMSHLTNVDEICLALTSHQFYDLVKFNNTPPSLKATFKLSHLCPRPALFLMKMYRTDIPFNALMWRLAHWLEGDRIRSLLKNKKQWLRSLPVKRDAHVQVVTSWDHISKARYKEEMANERFFNKQFSHDITWAQGTIAQHLLEIGTTRKELDNTGVPRYLIPQGRLD